MTKANKFPEWLPTYIYTRSVHLIEKVDLNSAEPLLLRLVTHDNMKGVWKTLSNKATDPQQLINFLDFVRLHPALELKPTNPINLLGDTSQRVVFNKIDKLVKRLINELKDLSLTREAEDGWRMLESTLNRAEFGNLMQHNEESSKFFEIKQIQSALESIQQEHSVTDILEVVSLTAQYACFAPDAHLPVKRNTQRAKYNWLILDLKRYLKKHFNTQSPIMIANIVNVAFDLSHDSVNEDDVRKMKK
ncbi:MAG: hypothetical protein CTY37_00385 [Methylotenera sp.]|nr:MAG: hypothetical protein CTY37_00385 [Methylotenera sp.]